MICPFCDSDALELRPVHPDDGATLHVYKCLNCQQIFTDIFVTNHRGLHRKALPPKHTEQEQNSESENNP